MKEMMIFENENFGELRSLEIENEVWFVAKDVCEILGLKNPTKSVGRLDKDERTNLKLGRQGNTNFVNEYGLYNLVLSSRKPEAKAFKRWITHEVLPSIRRTGSFNSDSTSKLLEALTNNQINTNNALLGFKNQMEDTAKTLKRHEEMLAKRVYLSPKEASEVRIAVCEKVRNIAYNKNLEYQFVRKYLFQRIYKALDENFGVATYRELPSMKMNEILAFIKKVKIYTDDLLQSSWQLDFSEEY